ncbi:MAG: hypothetical protein ACLP9S_17855 [Syntrophales bacterium]|jgi:hypothetical protein
MSIPSISSSSDYYKGYSINGSDSLRQRGQQALKSIVNALQSGNLSGAQSAFASLLSLFPNSSSSANSKTQSAATLSASSSSNGTKSIISDLSALGQALQSGDLTGAQNNFSKLTQDMQSIGVGHHHHHKTSASSKNTTNASATGSNKGTNSVETDLAALGQALQSGDLKSAGNAYSQLIQNIQTIKSAGRSINISA